MAAGALLIAEAGGSVTDLNNKPFTLRTRDMLCSQGEPVHQDILQILDSVDALSYAEEACELPAFLNVRKNSQRRFTSWAIDRPASLWYEGRGQN